MLESILVNSGNTTVSVLILLICAMVLGVLSAMLYAKLNRCSSSFAVTLSVLPLITGIVILVVNGNLGAGLAVAGAFSLIRFRSVQGTGREILAIFLSMALGLCLGSGYLGVAGLLFLLYAVMVLVMPVLHLGEDEKSVRELRISVPESLDYDGLFEPVLEQFGVRYELLRVRTVDMGSTYQLTYRISLPQGGRTRELVDAIRTENGNLPVSIGHMQSEQGM